MNSIGSRLVIRSWRSQAPVSALASGWSGSALRMPSSVALAASRRSRPSWALASLTLRSSGFLTLSSRAVLYSSIGLGELFSRGPGVGQEDMDRRVINIDVQAVAGPFLGRASITLRQVPLGQRLAHGDVVGVDGRDHRPGLQELTVFFCRKWIRANHEIHVI